MQGYIIQINRVKDEDLIVSIITQANLYTVYRFYGARHGIINLGFKIDFELETSLKSSIARLKDVMHISFDWMYEHKKLRLWQTFISLFAKHLVQTQEIDEFYFNLIEYASQQWGKQNAKRVAIEAYVQLLRFEGRLHTEDICFLCGQKVDGDIAMLRAYLPTHPHCSHRLHVRPEAMRELISHNSSFFLDDNEVDILWNVLLEGF
jgi:hypothetical protein